MSKQDRSAFTLVEILIVVVILGILAAIIIPSLTGAAEESSVNATYADLQKLRRAVGVYQVRNNGVLPPIVEGDANGAADGEGPWGPLVSNSGEYFLNAPVNAYVGGANGRVVVLGSGPDAEFHTEYGWIYNPDTGAVYAASFDANDKPIPRNP